MESDTAGIIILAVWVAIAWWILPTLLEPIGWPGL